MFHIYHSKYEFGRLFGIFCRYEPRICPVIYHEVRIAAGYKIDESMYLIFAVYPFEFFCVCRKGAEPAAYETPVDDVIQSVSPPNALFRVSH